MKRVLSRIALALLAVVGVYVTLVIGGFALGLVAGFVRTYAEPRQPVTIQNYTCDNARPTPNCHPIGKPIPVVH